MPKISIIIPVYNVEKYLSICLDSILAQSFTDFEVICINDGSDDKSLEILNEYKNKDSRIRVISQENAGVSAARNRGLNVANGEYISFVDPDDWIEPDCYEIAYNKAVNTNADMLFFGAKYVTDEIVEEKNLKSLYICLEENDNLNEMIHITHTIWNKLFKNSFLKKHNIKFAENLKIAEDGVFNYFCILSNPNIVFLPVSLYNHRISRDNSLTTQITPIHDIEACKYLINTEIFANAAYKYKVMALQKFIMNMLWWAKQPRARWNIFKNRKAINEFKNYVIANVGIDILIECFNYPELKDFCNPNYLAKLFSVKNTYFDGQKIKIVNILGIKIKIEIGKKNNSLNKKESLEEV